MQHPTSHLHTHVAKEDLRNFVLISVILALRNILSLSHSLRLISARWPGLKLLSCVHEIKSNNKVLHKLPPRLACFGVSSNFEVQSKRSLVAAY